MESADKIKSIVAGFTNCSPESVNESTRIDREALRSSIMVHRLFAVLQSEGIIVNDYSTIKTVGELINTIYSKEPAKMHTIRPQVINGDTDLGIGIDIELLEKFPDAKDFREDDFYKLNFSPQEIAFCILKTNPKQSFAGLFAAKEALVKVDNTFLGLPFSSIEINHDDKGKPAFKGFSISISHTDTIAIAVAAKNNTHQASLTNEAPLIINKIPTIYKLIIFISFLLSVIVALLTFVKG